MESISVWTTLVIWMVCFTLSLLTGRMLYLHLLHMQVLRAIPSPPALPIFGLVTDFIRTSQEEIFRNFREYSRLLRPIYRLSVLHLNYVNLVNAADIEQVLTNYTHLSKNRTYGCLQEWLSTGLLTSTASKWHARRKLLTPTFHFKVLQNFLAIFNDETDKLVKKLAENLDDSGIEISRYIDHFALQSAGETAMGWDLVDEGVLLDYRQNITRIRQIITKRFSNFWYRDDFVYSWTNLAYDEKNVCQSLHRFTDTVIRRRKIMRRGSTVERDRPAMLDLLLKYREEGTDISDEGIREEIDTFMFDAHDTITIAICMFLIMIANHKDVQEKIVQEIEAVLGETPRHVTPEDLPKLEYLECCINETLRLYPSVPTIGRRAGEDFTTSTGYRVPAGSSILMHIYDLHRDGTIYPNPEKFDPDRFKPEIASKRPPFSFIPFSGGPRNCIGQKFAMWELKTVACRILQNFNLAPVDTPMDVKFYMDLILRTNSPLRVKLIKK